MPGNVSRDLAQGAFGMLDFSEIYDEHLPRVYGYVAYRVASRTDAEDITQETFLRAFAHWQDFDARRSQASTWLISIARNLIVDHYRATSRRPKSSHLDAVPEGRLPAARGDLHDVELLPGLSSAIAELADREREIIGLRFGADLTGAEIAALTGLSVANVHQILSRSLRKLRVLLAEPDRRARSAGMGGYEVQPKEDGFSSEGARSP
jgi:RNA polymerase sigma-70 factor (ECF subfamily)